MDYFLRKEFLIPFQLIMKGYIGIRSQVDGLQARVYSLYNS
ncbi:hypothetical protein KsCSTR_27810 [Candidatus Kuenenia stuttgartiensis]|uniref:Uncharacterized protein n=1 Tax=Kuenenia stuttgartiensis TaxID=174633 RepID=A0A6G7GRC9_KUEST|nr:hypothetical protein KsCSTR_27810 [Candidatus Kuenenia stuttgartiensis]